MDVTIAAHMCAGKVVRCFILHGKVILSELIWNDERES